MSNAGEESARNKAIQSQFRTQGDKKFVEEWRLADITMDLVLTARELTRRFSGHGSDQRVLSREDL